MSTINETVPTTNPCPWWCRLEPGHGYDVVFADGASRLHDGYRTRMTNEFGRESWQVLVSALETERPDGRIVAEELTIHVDADLVATAAEVEELVTDLEGALTWLRSASTGNTGDEQ